MTFAEYWANHRTPQAESLPMREAAEVNWNAGWAAAMNERDRRDGKSPLGALPPGYSGQPVELKTYDPLG